MPFEPADRSDHDDEEDEEDEDEHEDEHEDDDASPAAAPSPRFLERISLLKPPGVNPAAAYPGLPPLDLGAPSANESLTSCCGLGSWD
jgi:hypothetical protein